MIVNSQFISFISCLFARFVLLVVLLYADINGVKVLLQMRLMVGAIFNLKKWNLRWNMEVLRGWRRSWSEAQSGWYGPAKNNFKPCSRCGSNIIYGAQTLLAMPLVLVKDWCPLFQLLQLLAFQPFKYHLNVYFPYFQNNFVRKGLITPKTSPHPHLNNLKNKIFFQYFHFHPLNKHNSSIPLNKYPI